MIYKMSAEDDVVYTRAETENEAFEKLTKTFGDMPRSLVTINPVSEDLEIDEEDFI